MNNAEQNHPFRQLIDRGDLEGIRSALQSNPSWASERISWGYGKNLCLSDPLHYLSDAPFHRIWNHGKQTQIARILLESGAPVDGLPSSNESPLHGAASLGEPALAEVLIDHGANLESVAQYPGIIHGTPLEFATHFGMRSVAEILYARGAKVYSAAMAAGVGDESLMMQLLPNTNAEELSEVLRTAVVCNQQSIVLRLWQYGLSADHDIQGASPLHWAAWEMQPEMVRFLLAHAADPHSLDSKYNLTPSGWAQHRLQTFPHSQKLQQVIQILSQTL